ncbi:hypothetical protein PR202_ga11681 [Eleusine coracana subsp. coracana]|uniref:3'-N-debenzoyl-2'-deoxytaxol N-benzoyltransferase n=1 Tax=Eleusine coracana subsp. coracana TaxID=191504 RepID=A0AAV5CA86_ELECO|nr:hypothetical protein PR202_ga11681 [Eleusine coracana subsp. coracana]
MDPAPSGRQSLGGLGLCEPRRRVLRSLASPPRQPTPLRSAPPTHARGHRQQEGRLALAKLASTLWWVEEETQCVGQDNGVEGRQGVDPLLAALLLAVGIIDELLAVSAQSVAERRWGEVERKRSATEMRRGNNGEEGQGRQGGGGSRVGRKWWRAAVRRHVEPAAGVISGVSVGSWGVRGGRKGKMSKHGQYITLLFFCFMSSMAKLMKPINPLRTPSSLVDGGVAGSKGDRPVARTALKKERVPVADCSLDDVNGLDYPLMLSEEELLPAPEEGVDPTSIPVMMQVTEFACGGFVVGLVAVHTLADGLGAAQFINAISEFARGLKKPTVKPVWARALIPSPPKLPPGPPPSFESFGFQHFTTDVTSDRISHVKAEYFQSTGQYCSTFDVAIAKVWQARTRALKYNPEDQVHVCFFANTRHLLAQVLPKEGGFYGNCFYPVTVTATVKDVVSAGLLDVIKMIRDGKARLPLEFAKWASGDVRTDPYELTFEHNVLFVSDWSRLGFFEVDFGWGVPIHIIPFTYADYMAVAVLGALPVPKKGTRIMTQCVEEKHIMDFKDEMKAFF